jgi:hypothetical protein
LIFPRSRATPITFAHIFLTQSPSAFPNKRTCITCPWWGGEFTVKTNCVFLGCQDEEVFGALDYDGKMMWKNCKNIIDSLEMVICSEAEILIKQIGDIVYDEAQIRKVDQVCCKSCLDKQVLRCKNLWIFQKIYHFISCQISIPICLKHLVFSKLFSFMET